MSNWKAWLMKQFNFSYQKVINDFKADQRNLTMNIISHLLKDNCYLDFISDNLTDLTNNKFSLKKCLFLIYRQIFDQQKNNRCYKNFENYKKIKL